MSGFVYFIAPEAVFVRPADDDLNRVKIGFTGQDPKARLRALQTGSPVPLDIIAYINGDLRTERAFHDCFAELAWQGEWFLLDRKLFDFLAYFSDLPLNQKFVTQEALYVSLYDNVFAPHSSHPRWSDAEYLASARPEFLASLFPEAVEQ